MREVVIVSAVRTPVGRHGGILKDVRVDDLTALVLREVLRRADVKPAAVEDIVFGCVDSAGEANGNLARCAALIAGFPFEVCGTTVNRFCGSALSAVNHCVHAIAFGAGDVMIGGGAESMTRAVWTVPKQGGGFPRGDLVAGDTMMSGSGGPFHPVLAAKGWMIDMATTAQNLADKYGISRQEMDEFALRSQQRAVAAIKGGRFKAEIVPVVIPQRRGEPIVVDTDEHPRADTSLERLAALGPAFPTVKDITAGNASGVNDGASAVLLMAAEKAKELGVRARARIVATAVAGVDPTIMGIGPAFAIPKALKRAGLTLDDMDLVEINEAFAAQTLACMRELGIDHERLNVNGGAVAHGHALGNSGARILTTLLYELERRGGRYGVASLCIGGGQGIATVIERI